MKLRYRLSNLKYRTNAFVGQIGCKLVRWAARDSNLLAHAKSEWKYTFPDNDDMQDMMGEHIFDMTAMFSLAGHSGFSGGYALKVLPKVLDFEPLSPLTGADDEWGEPYSGEGTQQNRRCSHVFRDANGRAYDIDGRVFVEPSGSAYTGPGSRVYVTFPYTPTTEYVHVDNEWKEVA